MVVNGACKYKDMEHFKKYMSGDVRMEYLGEQQLVALQVYYCHCLSIYKHIYIYILYIL